MPPDELYMLQRRPLSSQKLDGSWVSGVDSERSDRRESLAEKVGDEGGGGGGGDGGKERMAPRGEERKVEINYGSETIGKEKKVTDVTPESEGSAGGALKKKPFVAD